jgi:hypothetical protein
MEFVSCQLPGAENFEEVLRVLENLCTPVWMCVFVFFCIYIYIYKHKHKRFCCGDVFQKRFCLDSEDISSALQYSSERVALVTRLLPLRISQRQGVRKDTKDNGGFETEHKGRSGSNFSQHAATSDAELPEMLGGMW